MKNELTPYEKLIVNKIEIGELHSYLGSLVSYPEKRVRYSKTINHLKKLELIIEFHGELTVNLSSKYYQKY